MWHVSLVVILNLMAQAHEERPFQKTRPPVGWQSPITSYSTSSFYLYSVWDITLHNLVKVSTCDSPLGLLIRVPSTLTLLVQLGPCFGCPVSGSSDGPLLEPMRTVHPQLYLVGEFRGLRNMLSLYFTQCGTHNWACNFYLCLDDFCLWFELYVSLSNLC